IAGGETPIAGDEANRDKKKIEKFTVPRRDAGLAVAENGFPPDEEGETGQQRERGRRKSHFGGREALGDSPAEAEAQKDRDEIDDGEPFEPGHALAKRGGKAGPQSNQNANHGGRHFSEAKGKEMAERLSQSQRHQRTEDARLKKKTLTAREQSMETHFVVVATEMGDVVDDCPR